MLGKTPCVAPLKDGEQMVDGNESYGMADSEIPLVNLGQLTRKEDSVTVLV